MAYLFIKEIAEKTSAEEVIIIVSTLLKDLNSDNELFRANSLRVLSRILDVGSIMPSSSSSLGLAPLPNRALHQASHRPQKPDRRLLRPPLRPLPAQRESGGDSSLVQRNRPIAELRRRDGPIPRFSPPFRHETQRPARARQGGSTFPRLGVVGGAAAAAIAVFAVGGLPASSCRHFAASRRSRAGASPRAF